jgi:hypothetical protein
MTLVRTSKHQRDRRLYHVVVMTPDAGHGSVSTLQFPIGNDQGARRSKRQHVAAAGEGACCLVSLKLIQACLIEGANFRFTFHRCDSAICANRKIGDIEEWS